MKSTFHSRTLLLVFLAIVAVGCNKTPPADTASPKPMVNPTTVSDAMAAKKPGSYCLRFKEGNHSIEGRMELSAGNEVNGTLKGHQVDESTGADNVYDTSFNGSLQGDSLKLSVLSSASGSKEQTNQTWIWKKEGILEGTHLLQPVECVN